MQHTCPRCDGTGRTKPPDHPRGLPPVDCPLCADSGRIDDETLARVRGGEAIRAERNPIKRLRSWTAVQSLPLDSRNALRRVLLDLRHEANELAELSWKRRKGPMAAYWRAVSTYARHIAACTSTTGEYDAIREEASRG